jgi:1,4-alpha-glucan branching enzyme
VRLVLAAPGAESVSVVGDWNGWDPERDRLRDPDGDGVWEIRLRLQSGQEARYQFLVDGERWLADPLAPLRVEDGFGGTSSVLQI